MKHALSLIALFSAVPVFAQDARQLDAHEHGVGVLNIAIESNVVSMEFHAPGADIVGFEYAAKTDADLAAIKAVVATLSAPLDLFILPDASGCSVTNAVAELESEEGHGDHHDDHHDEDHAKEGHGDHHDEDHAKEGHDDHHDEDHAKEGHDDHHDEDHADEAGHTEFHAEYTLNCENPGALTEMTFAYFKTFPNAKEVEVQVISASGAHAYEVERDAPVLKLEH
jgi:hypothetical protein